MQPGVDHQVFHEFLNQGGKHFDRHLTPDYYEQVSEELAAIEAFAAIPVLDESMILEQRTQYRDELISTDLGQVIAESGRPARSLAAFATISSATSTSISRVMRYLM